MGATLTSKDAVQSIYGFKKGSTERLTSLESISSKLKMKRTLGGGES